MGDKRYLLAHCLGNYGDISYTLLAEINDEEDGKELGEKMKNIIYHSEDANEEMMTLFIDRYNKSQYKTYYLTTPALSGDHFCMIHEKSNDDSLFDYTDYIEYAIV